MSMQNRVGEGESEGKGSEGIDGFLANHTNKLGFYPKYDGKPFKQARNHGLVQGFRKNCLLHRKWILGKGSPLKQKPNSPL